MKVKVQLWVAGVLIGVFLGWVFFALILPWIQRTVSQPSLGTLSMMCVAGVISRWTGGPDGGDAC